MCVHIQPKHVIPIIVPVLSDKQWACLLLSDCGSYHCVSPSGTHRTSVSAGLQPRGRLSRTRCDYQHCSQSSGDAEKQTSNNRAKIDIVNRKGTKCITKLRRMCRGVLQETFLLCTTMSSKELPWRAVTTRSSCSEISPVEGALFTFLHRPTRDSTEFLSRFRTTSYYSLGMLQICNFTSKKCN